MVWTTRVSLERYSEVTFSFISSVFKLFRNASLYGSVDDCASIEILDTPFGVLVLPIGIHRFDVIGFLFFLFAIYLWRKIRTFSWSFFFVPASFCVIEFDDVKYLITFIASAICIFCLSTRSKCKKKTKKQFKSIKLISILETAPLQIFSSILFKRLYYTIYFKPWLSLHSENSQATRIHLKFLSQNDIICLINKINRLTDYTYIVKLSSVVVWTKLNSALQ